jgi:hypothetical protein
MTLETDCGVVEPLAELQVEVPGFAQGQSN